MGIAGRAASAHPIGRKHDDYFTAATMAMKDR